MPPRIPADRIGAVIAASAQVFVTHGYRRAQVQDVAEALGVAKGTVYGYARSKEALFAAAIRYGDGLEPLPAVGDLPLPTPHDGAVVALVSERLGAEVAQLTLVKAAGDSSGERATMGAVVLDLYARLARHRVAIKLVDRCAPELPELGEVWFGAGRRAQVGALESYLAGRAATGELVLPGPAALVARTVVETCALWAVHCHFDPSPTPGGIDDDAVAAMLGTLFTRATTPGD